MLLGPLLYGLVILGFVALLAAAAVSDVRFYRIPNRLCAGVVILFAVFCLISLFGAGDLFRVDWLGGLMVGAAAMAIGAGVFALGLFGGGDVLAFADDLGEPIELAAATIVGRRLPAVRRIGRSAGTPHFVSVTDVIAGLLEQQRVGGNGRVPDGSLQDGSPPGPPEVLSGQQRTAAGRTGGGIHIGPREQHPLGGDAIEVGRRDDVARSARLQLRVGARVTAPIIGEGEQHVGPPEGVVRVTTARAKHDRAGKTEHSDDVPAPARPCGNVAEGDVAETDEPSLDLNHEFAPGVFSMPIPLAPAARWLGWLGRSEIDD